MATFREIPTPVGNYPQVIPNTDSSAARLAEAFGTLLRAGTAIAGSAAQSQQAEADRINQQNKEALALSRWEEASKEASADLEEKGYRLEGQKANIQSNMLDQARADQIEQQEIDLPGMIGKYKGNLKALLVDNPGLLQPVRDKVVDLIAANEAKADLIDFDKVVAEAPMRGDTRDIDTLFNEFVGQRLPAMHDDQERGRYQLAMQEGFLREKASRTVQQYEKDRLNAIDAADIALKDEFSALLRLNALTPAIRDEMVNKYITNVGSIDNSRSNVMLRATAFKAISDVLLDETKLNSEQALERYNMLYPAGAKFGDSLDEGLAAGLRTQIEARLLKDKQRFVDNTKTAINASNNPLETVFIKNTIDNTASSTLDDQSKLEVNAAVNDRNSQIFKLELESATNNNMVDNIMNQARLTKEAGALSDLDYQAIQKKAGETKVKYQYDTDVENIIAGTKGSNLIPINDNHYPAIDKYVNSLLEPVRDATGAIVQPGKSLAEAYTAGLSRFGLLTKNQIDNLNNMTEVVPGQSPDFRFEKISQLASTFAALDTVNRAYMSNLILAEKLNPKAETLALNSMYFGRKPEDLALYLKDVPNVAYAAGLDFYKAPKPKAGVKDSVTAIKETFARTPSYVSPEIQRMYRGAYLYHYARTATDSPGSSPEQIAATAISLAQNDLRGQTYTTKLGPQRVVINPLRMPMREPSQYEMLNNVWTQTSKLQELNYEALKYDTTVLDIERMGISEDGKNYLIPVYQNSVAGGRERPVANFLYPVSETDQKKLSDSLNISTFSWQEVPIVGSFVPSDTTKKIDAGIKERDRILNSMFAPIGRK